MPFATKPTAELYPHQAEVTKWMEDVVAGKISVAKKVRLAVVRHLGDLKKSTKKAYLYWFDAKRASRVISFASLFYLDKKGGKPFKLEPFQKFIVWVLFGWKRKSDGMRRFLFAFITMARGNGKSPFAALLLMILAFFDSPRVLEPEIVLAATKREQTKYVYAEVARFVAQHQELLDRCDIQTRLIKIGKYGMINRLGADGSGEDGGRYHAVVVDELHEWKEKHRKLLDKLRTGLGKDPQSLLIFITTAGNERSKLWNEQYTYCDKVIRGVVQDDEWFIFMAEIDADDNPLDSSCWYKASPNLGVSCFIRTIEAIARKAEHDPLEMLNLLRYYCNVRVRSQARIISEEMWKCGSGKLPSLIGMQCTAGLDLGWNNDLAALALVFGLGAEDDPNRRYAVKCWAWVPEKGPRNLKQEPFRTFIKQGWLQVIPGKSFDPDFLYEQLRVCKELYDVRSIACDKNNAQAVGMYVQKYLKIKFYGFQQSVAKYNAPIKRFTDGLSNGRILHGDNEMLGWFFDNLVVKTDAAGLVMPDKEHSEDKIDGAVATLMGYSEFLHMTDVTFNPYLKRGLRKFEL